MPEDHRIGALEAAALTFAVVFALSVWGTVLAAQLPAATPIPSPARWPLVFVWLCYFVAPSAALLLGHLARRLSPDPGRRPLATISLLLVYGTVCLFLTMFFLFACYWFWTALRLGRPPAIHDAGAAVASLFALTLLMMFGFCRAMMDKRAPSRKVVRKALGYSVALFACAAVAGSLLNLVGH